MSGKISAGISLWAVNFPGRLLSTTERMTDSENIESSSDDAQFVQLIAEHQNVLRGFIITLLPGAPGVDDVFQNTNAVIWKKRETFELGTNFRAWAMSIARFQALAHMQQLRRRRWVTLDRDVAEQLADDFEAQPDAMDLDGRSAALDECIEKLRPKDRELLVERYWHRTRLQDFAVVSGRSVNALKVTLFRIRAALKRCIEEHPNSSVS